MTSRINHNDPRKDGALSLTYHYEMLADTRRLAPFIRSIETTCPGKVVFESGTGSGILTLLAARSGARHVYCTELDPNVAKFARENIKRSGYADRITLLEKSTLEVSLSDLAGTRPDVIMAENLSTWQVTEPENEIMNRLRTTIAHPGTIRIPARAHNYLELVYSRYRFLDAVELRTHYFEFTGIPVAESHSEPCRFSTFDYAGITDTSIAREIAVAVKRSGVVNSLRLTSPLEVSPGNNFSASDSLMPPVVVPLPSDIPVTAGDSLVVRIAYKTNTTWELFSCEARPMT